MFELIINICAVESQALRILFVLLISFRMLRLKSRKLLCQFKAMAAQIFPLQAGGLRLSAEWRRILI